MKKSATAVLLLVLVSLLAAGCSEGDQPETSNPTATTSTVSTTITNTTTVAPPAPTAPTTTRSAEVPFRTAAQVLADDGYAVLEGLRVGLIANQTSRVDGGRLIDALVAAPSVELAAIFAPEHGVDGSKEAGETFADGTDSGVDVPVFSLYGSASERKPTPEMLEGLDVLVFDLQDVGTRFYTYISTMGLAMQAAAEAGIPFVVLDRPNPQGGERVEGFVRADDQVSFVSRYPIPTLYGMTSGELAGAIRGEGWLEGVTTLELTVIQMDGWSRSDLWSDTGMEWLPPSPGLPDLPSTYAYPGTVLFEATTLSCGRGTLEPFAVIGAAWADGEALARVLDDEGLPGVEFEPVEFVPEVLPIAPSPRHEGERQVGVRVVVTDPARFEPVRTGIHMLVAFQEQASAAGRGSIVDRADFFDLLAGTSRLQLMLADGSDAEAIVASWAGELSEFVSLRRRYLRYE
jgi:uncharacterized protein YbbC (DUF1343 family)